MKDLKSIRNQDLSQGLYLDLGQSSLKIMENARGLQIPVTRSPQGHLTEEARSVIREALASFLGPSTRRGIPALCALSASGVSVRHFTLPPASREATRRLLAMQMEQAFPIPPDSLAWGYRIYGSRNGYQQGEKPTRQQVSVLALRCDVLEDHSALLAGCGLRPTFTLSTLAASRLCPVDQGSCSVLDIGRHHTEWLCFEEGRPVQVRILHWGGEDVTLALARALHLDRDEAETRKCSLPRDPGETRSEPAVLPWFQESLRPLLKFLGETLPARDSASSGGPARLFLVGGGARLPDLARCLSGGLGSGVTCDVLETERPPGHSAVTLGLQAMEEKAEENPPIHFLTPAGNGLHSPDVQVKALRPWAILAVALVLGILALRYLPPIWKLNGLRERFTRVEQALSDLPVINRELSFLNALEKSRAPVLEVLTVFARIAPPEAVLQDLTLDARGGTTLQVLLKANETNDFRTRLTRSGWFSDVVLQSLTPAKKRKVSIRFTARITPPATGLDGVEPYIPPSAGKPGTRPSPALKTVPGGKPAPVPKAVPGGKPAPVPGTVPGGKPAPVLETGKEKARHAKSQ